MSPGFSEGHFIFTNRRKKLEKEWREEEGGRSGGGAEEARRVFVFYVTLWKSERLCTTACPLPNKNSSSHPL